jgi:hypothetical protein
VHRPADAVPDVLTDDPEFVWPNRSFDRVTDVPDPRPRLGLGDADV